MKQPNWNELSTVGKGVYVKESTLLNAGLGLFAEKDFHKGDWITIYDGQNITRENAKKILLPSHVAARDGVLVDGLKEPIIGRGGGSFSNSSTLKKYSNAEIEAWLGVLLIRATMLIPKNSEIFVYYGKRGFLLSKYGSQFF